MLSNISCELGLSYLTLITGNNGSGKSTLLKIIQKEVTIDQGSITFPNDFSENYFSDSLGYALYGQLTVSENQNVFNFDSSSFFSLKQILKKKVSNLSSGELQKIALNRVLGSDKKWLFFDEPTSHLDHTAKLDFVRFLEQISKIGKKIILATHESELFSNFHSSTVTLGRNDED